MNTWKRTVLPVAMAAAVGGLVSPAKAFFEPFGGGMDQARNMFGGFSFSTSTRGGGYGNGRGYGYGVPGYHYAPYASGYPYGRYAPYGYGVPNAGYGAPMGPQDYGARQGYQATAATPANTPHAAPVGGDTGSEEPAATAPATPATGDIKIRTVNGANVLTDTRGMTLYTFTQDGPGQSSCYGQCAQNWPPLTADTGATPEGDFTLIERSDGSLQWAFDGNPLYTWVGDRQPGDMTGDGVGGVWNAVTL